MNIDDAIMKSLSVAMQHRGVNADSPFVKSFAKRYGFSKEDLKAIEIPEDQKPDHFVCWRCNGNYSQTISGVETLCDCDQGIKWNDGLTEAQRENLPRRFEVLAQHRMRPKKPATVR